MVELGGRPDDIREIQVRVSAEVIFFAINYLQVLKCLFALIILNYFPI